MFEKFQVRSLYVAIEELLSLYASGRTTGVVVASGYSTTRVIPIFESYSLPHAIKRIQIGGRDSTEYLTKLLNERYCLTSASEIEIVNDLKEKMCKVAQQHDDIWQPDATHGCEEHQFELPDGTLLTMDEERLKCPEILFQPSMIGKECEGIHKSTFDCIMDDGLAKN